MPTTIDSGVTSASALGSNRAQHLWTMSNGDVVVVYFNGTNWGYRVKHSGTWGSFTSMATLPTAGTDLNGAGCRNGDTLYFGAGSNTTAFRVAKMVYATATQTFTVTYSNSTGDSAPIFGAYYDGTNNYVHVLARLADVGLFSYAFNGTTITQNKITGKAVTGAPVDSGGNQDAWGYATVGDGTSTFFCIMADAGGSTTLKVTKLVAGTTTYTQTAETSVPALAAAPKGVDAIYDGTNVTILANENNAKLRVTRRTAANTYDAWADIDTGTLSGAPDIGLKASTGDIVVVWDRTGGQANGEIYQAQRTGGTWGTGALLAGGATTGWQTPNAELDDSNETAGLIRVVYVTGTASPWSLVEDSVSIGGGGTVAVSDSDTMSVAATVTLVASISGSETATLSSATTLGAAVSATDQASQSDASPSIGQAGTDSGALAEAAILAAALAGSESLGLADSAGVVGAPADSDAGSTVDATTLAAAANGQDSATTTDQASSLAAAAADADTAAGASSATTAGTVAGSDAATVADSGSVSQGGSSPTSSDGATLSETALVSATVSAAETLAASDLSVLAAAIAGADAASQSDVLTLAVALVTADVIAEAEAATLAASGSVSDGFALSEGTQIQHSGDATPPVTTVTRAGGNDGLTKSGPNVGRTKSGPSDGLTNTSLEG